MRTHRLIVRKPELRFDAAAQPRSPDGLPIGTLCVLDTRARLRTLDDPEAVLAEVAARLGRHLEATDRADTLADPDADDFRIAGAPVQDALARLVELHGGCVATHSPGLARGSTFTLRLPHAGPTADEGAQGPRTEARSLLGEPDPRFGQRGPQLGRDAGRVGAATHPTPKRHACAACGVVESAAPPTDLP